MHYGANFIQCCIFVFVQSIATCAIWDPSCSYLNSKYFLQIVHVVPKIRNLALGFMKKNHNILWTRCQSLHPNFFTITHDVCICCLMLQLMFIYIEGKFKGIKGQNCMKGRGMGVYVH
jgi:hypothetical protein